MAKSKKNKTKPKLNLTVRDEQRNKLEQMASLEKRSISNLIEVMADERWDRLVEQQGIAYAKTVAEAMNLKLDMNDPADREKLRRAILDVVAERKMPKQKWRRRKRQIQMRQYLARLPFLPESAEIVRTWLVLSESQNVGLHSCRTARPAGRVEQPLALRSK